MSLTAYVMKRMVKGWVVAWVVEFTDTFDPLYDKHLENLKGGV